MNYTVTDNKIIFNVSKGKENYSQRNNKFVWTHPKNPDLYMNAHSMCNVTSIVMALDYAGWKFPKGNYTQAEDNLCEFIFTNQEVLDFYKNTMPREYQQFEDGDGEAFCPNLIHAVLEFGVNKWMNTTVDTFSTNVKIEDILQDIVQDEMPVVLSGNFPYTYKSGNKGTLGHINVLVGVVFDAKSVLGNISNASLLNKIPTHVIIDDPYGNYTKNFQETGNDVWMEWEEFKSLYKPLGDGLVKWAHKITPPPKVV